MSGTWRGWICVVASVALVACASPGRAVDAEPRAAAAPEKTSHELSWRAELLRAQDEGRVNDAVRSGLSAEEAWQRRAAVRALGRIDDPEMQDALLAALDDDDASVRAEAILAAAFSGSNGAVAAISARAGDADPRVRTAVAVALGLLAGPDGRAALNALLGDDVKDVRMAACFSAASQSGADELAETLLTAIEDPDAEVRASAVYALSRLSGRLNAVEFITRFKIRERFLELAETRDPGLRVLIVEGMYSPLSGPQADTLHDLMYDSDHPDVLLAIIRATSFPGAPTFVFHEVLIKHADERVVLGTILGLGRMRGEDVSGLLLRFILKDSRDWLKADAIRSLASVDRRMMLQVANGLANDPSPVIRAATAETLYGREEPEAATYAKRLFDTDNAWVRLHAIPAMASVEEPLGEVLGEVLESGTLEARLQVVRAAGYRLAMSARPDADHADAVALLARLWDQAVVSGAVEMQLAVIEAAAEGRRQDGAALIRKALQAGDLGVRRRAVSVLRSGFDEIARLDHPESKPLSHYQNIVLWSQKQHAAVVTVERRGFIPGRFTIALDTQNAPLTAWHFAQLAIRGHYDNRRINPYRPGLRLHSGLGGDNRYAYATWPAEPVFSLFSPGTLAAPGDSATLFGEWMVTLNARPHYFGRHLAFGQVVQNLEGVVTNVLPIDRVVSVRMYEGSGLEDLPPLE